MPNVRNKAGTQTDQRLQKVLGSRVFSKNLNTKLGYAIVRNASVLLAEVYAILQSGRINSKKAIENEQIQIMLDSQTTIKFRKLLVRDCIEELRTLADRTRVKLVWVLITQLKSWRICKRGSKEIKEPYINLGVAKIQFAWV